jgi:hypothetical protein
MSIGGFSRRLRNGVSSARLNTLILLVFSLHLLAPDSLAATKYWLAGEDPVVQKDKHKTDPADYMDLFNSTAQWASSAAGLNVFQISTQMALRGTDEQLQTIINGLKANHIAMSIELGLLSYSDSCGKGTEGFSAPLAVEAVSKRISKLGGQLDYVSMDEPVTWGHAKVGNNPQGIAFCSASVATLVDMTAPKIAILQHYFPNIQIGEVDGINSRFPSLSQDILDFVDQIQAKLHIKVAFVHADVAWDTNWRPMLQQLTAGLRARGVRVGIICDGNVSAPSDAAWTDQALGRCTDVYRDPKTRPDDLMVQTWLPQPTRMLPESQPGTLTHLLKQVQTTLR